MATRGATPVGHEAPPRVIDVTRGHGREAAEVLVRALRAYPTMRWLCRSERAGFEDRLRALYRVALAMQHIERQPTLGVLDGERLVAVAILHDPGRALTPRSALAGLLGSVFSSARSSMLRGHRYENAIAGARPRDPHHFLSVIGVLPSEQRRGHGRALMEAIHARAARDPRSLGVCLDTCDPGNRDYYESFGYEVLDRCETGPLEQWIMLSPGSCDDSS